MELIMSAYSMFVAKWRESKGFITSWENMLSKLMLVVTEVSEAAEAYRHDDKEAFTEEIADVFIRLLDIVGTLNIDIEGAIEAKMEVNALRPWQHGTVQGDVSNH